MYLFIIFHTLRNKSDTEEMKIMKNLIRKSDYVRNNDQRDPIAVLKLSDEKFIKHKKEIGFVVHTLIPKSTKFVQTNKIGMFPGPLSFPFGPYGFLFMLIMILLHRQARFSRPNYITQLRKLNSI